MLKNTTYQNECRVDRGWGRTWRSQGKNSWRMMYYQNYCHWNHRLMHIISYTWRSQGRSSRKRRRRRPPQAAPHHLSPHPCLVGKDQSWPNVLAFHPLYVFEIYLACRLHIVIENHLLNIDLDLDLNSDHLVGRLTPTWPFPSNLHKDEVGQQQEWGEAHLQCIGLTQGTVGNSTVVLFLWGPPGIQELFMQWVEYY